MPVLLWLSRLVGSTVAWVTNLVAAAGLFLLSAHLFQAQDEDALVPAWILRSIAAIWMWGATWHYLKHGVLQRPKVTPDANRPKPTGAQAALASLGCLATIAAIVVTGAVVGPWADWAYAGATGDDPAHPARVALARVATGAEAVARHPDAYVPIFIAVGLTLVALRVVGAAASRSRQPQEDAPRTKRRRARRDDVTRAAPAGAAASGVTPSAGSSGVPARATPTSRPPRATGPGAAPRMSNSGRTLDDPMLGALRRDEGVGGWRLLNPRADVGALVIEADGEPTDQQLAAGRTLVQRSFEALLRASDAARPLAQADGVGLPRFTVVESIVRNTRGPQPAVTMRLRCEGDAARTYEVTSTDGMQTFSG